MSIYGGVYDKLYGNVSKTREDNSPTSLDNPYKIRDNYSTSNYSGLGNSLYNNNYQSSLGGSIFGEGTNRSNALNSILGNSKSGAMDYMKSGGGTPWTAIGGAAKSGYNLISNKDDKDYSDLEESVIYPLQGASVGANFGPWGALGGALYGLGYSFKDDLGLKDSNFLTQLLFPIGMGDGGGLKIGNTSILDLG